MKITELTNKELFKQYIILTQKINGVNIISQSNPGKILEIRYYQRIQQQIYEELQNRLANKDKFVSSH